MENSPQIATARPAARPGGSGGAAGAPGPRQGPPSQLSRTGAPGAGGGHGRSRHTSGSPSVGRGCPRAGPGGGPAEGASRTRPVAPRPPSPSAPQPAAGTPGAWAGGARRARGPVPSPASMAGGGAPCARRLPRPSGPAPLSPPARVSWCRLRGRLIIDRLGSPRLCQQVAPVRPGAGWTRLPPPSLQGGKGAGGVQQGFAGMGAMGGGSRRAICASAQGPGR